MGSVANLLALFIVSRPLSSAATSAGEPVSTTFFAAS